MAPSSSLTPDERSQLAAAAAHESWANTADPTARTAPAREALDRRFEAEADPDGVLPPEERARRAEHLRRAFYSRLSARAAQARRQAAEARRAAEALDAVVAMVGAE